MQTASLSQWVTRGYEIRELIDQGGFGQVYRAYQPLIAREVAIKVILPVYANQPEFVRRFESEAQVIARLEHPHIVPLYDYWRDPEGAYLVMRWLRGGNLRTWTKDQALETAHAIRIIQQVAQALAAAHRNNIVHSDLKPENILMDEEGNAYLSDFGIAKDLARASQPDDQDHITGSWLYISPEQITGAMLTAQSDIYSLGIMLYELLTQTSPFADHTLEEMIVKHLHESLPPLALKRPDLPEIFNTIIQQATAKSPEDRFPNATVMAEKLYTALRLYEKQASQSLVMLLVENPYKGLRPFESSDASDFFGRETLIHQLLMHLSTPHPLMRFLAVIGPSGSGKSSVVKAGLVPALRHNAIPGSEKWFTVEMVPGNDPVAELDRALMRVATRPVAHLLDDLRQDQGGLLRALDKAVPQGELLLVIDQFEEIYTQAEAPEHFLALIAAAVTDPASRLRIIITLRADFYDRPLLHPTFSTLISQRTQVVIPMTPDELRRAIVAPAEGVGLIFEPDLVETIVNELSHEPGILPLLQYALTELFERREGNRLTLSAYRAIDGALGALARRADELYQALTPAEQGMTKQLFLRLVTLGEGTEDTRRRVLYPEVSTFAPIMDLFGKYRLLTFDRDPATRSPTVEVAHEALIRQWTQLQKWLETSRDDVRQQRKLETMAAEWHKHGQEASFLLSGVQLEQLEAWTENSAMMLTAQEQAYLNTSIARREQQEAAEAARLAREEALEARTQRIQRTLLIAMTFAAIVGSVLAVIAFSQRSQAHRQRENAESSAATAVFAQQQAESQAVIANRRADELQALALTEFSQEALTGEQPDLALPLALEANRIDQPLIQAQQFLSQLIPLTALRRIESSTRLTALAYNDDHLLLTGDPAGGLHLWDSSTGEMLREFSGHTAQINALAFTTDGKQTVSASNDGTLRLWDIATGEEVRVFSGHTDAVFTLAISGDVLVSGSRDQTVIVWDMLTGEILHTLSGHTDRISAVAVNGSQVLSGSADTMLILWDLASGEQVRQWKAHNGLITGVAFLPNGREALSSSIDMSVIHWDLAQGRQIRLLSGNNESLNGITVSADGRWAAGGSGSLFAGASIQNAVLIWDLSSGALVRQLRGHSSQVLSVAFSPDSSTLASISDDQSIRLWAVTPDQEIAQFGDTPEGYQAAAVSPDASYALTVDQSGNLILWDMQALKMGRIFINAHTGLVNALAISPDNRYALSASEDRNLILWDLATGDDLAHWTGHSNSVTAVAFSPDGRYALSGGRDRSVILWDVESGMVVRTFPVVHTNIITSVAFSPDGQRAVSAAADRSAIVWNVATGEQITRLMGHTSPVNIAVFSPDGARIVSGSSDQTLILWEAATGQPIYTLRGHSDWVLAAAFSPDGQTILSAGRDRTLRLWDVASGQMIRLLTGHTQPVVGVAISPDGSTALSAAEDVRTWAFSPEALVAWVETHRYVSALSCETQEQYRITQNADCAVGN